MSPARRRKIVHLRRTGREDPMEASMHIVLALETFFPRIAHVQIYAQVCTPYLGIGTMEIG